MTAHGLSTQLTEHFIRDKHMESYEKFEKIMDEGFSKEDLWDEIVQFLSEDQLSEFADHFMTINDMDVEED